MEPLPDWLLVGLWMAVLWGVSAIPGAWLPAAIDRNEPLRHLGHGLGFALLAALSYRAADSTLRRHDRTHARRWAMLGALAIGCAYALLDEGHQALVPGRASTLVDLGIDLLGVGGALIVAVMVGRLRAKWRGKQRGAGSEQS